MWAALPRVCARAQVACTCIGEQNHATKRYFSIFGKPGRFVGRPAVVHALQLQVGARVGALEACAPQRHCFAAPALPQQRPRTGPRSGSAATRARPRWPAPARVAPRAALRVHWRN